MPPTTPSTLASSGWLRLSYPHAYPGFLRHRCVWRTLLHARLATTSVTPRHSNARILTKSSQLPARPLPHQPLGAERRVSFHVTAAWPDERVGGDMRMAWPGDHHRWHRNPFHFGSAAKLGQQLPALILVCDHISSCAPCIRNPSSPSPPLLAAPEAAEGPARPHHFAGDSPSCRWDDG